jgi:phage-related protein
MKPLRFVGTSLKDLRGFPERARKQAGYQLFKVQRGTDPTDWKAMPTLGKGVNEVRIQVGDAYRIMYLARLPDAVYVLHAFQKKTQKTSKKDLQLTQARYVAAIKASSGEETS